MKTFAPIIIFAFNRLTVLKNTINSLKSNKESINSDLFIFVDGPRSNRPEDKGKVIAVQEYVKNVDGFKSIRYYFSNMNKGLARSIIEGTTKVINEYGKVIVIEDDLYLSCSFLKFMNQMLDLYEEDKRIMQVSGYSCKLKKINNYPFDAYISERAHSWTWGTWKDRWLTIDWDVKDFNSLKTNRKQQRDFCKRGSDLYGMLKKYMEGKNNSWYIRFNYSMFKQHRYAVCPIRSLVRNDGFIAESTHCNVYNRYKIDFEELHDGIFVVPRRLEPDEKIMSEAVKYWSIRYRIYGKFRTAIMRIFNKKSITF